MSDRDAQRWSCHSRVVRATRGRTRILHDLVAHCARDCHSYFTDVERERQVLTRSCLFRSRSESLYSDGSVPTTEALPQGVLLHQRRYPQQSRPRAQQDRAPQPRAAEEVPARQRQEQAGLQVNADARVSRGSGWRGTIEAVMRLSDVLPVPSVHGSCVYDSQTG